MTFKKEISFDGVAGMVVGVAVIGFLFKLQFTVEGHSAQLADHSMEIKQLHSILEQEQLKSEAADHLQKTSDDHEIRIRVLEKDADFLHISGGHQ